ncbi:MAG: PepSY-associated TM helix domain-containing protein [Hyphomonas sp.]
MRRVIFWTHFVFGLAAGVFILIMSVTGVLLAYESQIVQAARNVAVKAEPGADPLSVDQLVEAAYAAGAEPGNKLTLSGSGKEPVKLLKSRTDLVLLDPYSGAVLEDTGHGVKKFLARMESIHRWLAFTGKRNKLVSPLNSFANLVFGGLLLTGIVLWWPKMWRWPIVRAQLFFRRGLTNAKARHYNWHHVLAAWTLLPLAAIVFSGIVFSYGWANNLVYAAFGEAPPQRGGPPAPAAIAEALVELPTGPLEIDSYDAMLTQAVEGMRGWHHVTIILPEAGARSVSMTVDRGNGVQAGKQRALRIARDGSGPVATTMTATGSPASKARRFIRFLHTGEIFGLLGQTIAAIASAGAVVLVYTGLSLGIRRLIRMRKTARA